MVNLISPRNTILKFDYRDIYKRRYRIRAGLVNGASDGRLAALGLKDVEYVSRIICCSDRAVANLYFSILVFIRPITQLIGFRRLDRRRY